MVQFTNIKVDRIHFSVLILPELHSKLDFVNPFYLGWQGSGDCNSGFIWN